ncbi:MAG TPA: hypothetical protein VFA27_07960 [Vicinamibacterales bacterium]|nr:hypothetical protein [Vicinamibacterales bacterium]
MHKRMFCLLMICTALVVTASASISGQTAATRVVMHEKLELSQHVLEAVMTSDFDRLDRDTQALARLTEKPGWMVLTTPEYVRYSGAFVAVLQELTAAARDHDLDTAAVRYASMTMACYQCHRYVKRARLAKLRR